MNQDEHHRGPGFEFVCGDKSKQKKNSICD